MKSAPYCTVHKILTILNSNATSIFRLVGPPYRHNTIVLYSLHVTNHIFLFSVSYFTSVVNVKINYFSLSFSHRYSRNKVDVNEEIILNRGQVEWVSNLSYQHLMLVLTN